ncbi:MAG: NIPSNAP family protein [Vicinamibacterales bacterium]
MTITWSRFAWSALLLATGFALGSLVTERAAAAQAANRVFELRTYTAPEGKLGELQARFRNHTIRIFNKHDMQSVGYWVPQDAPNHDNTLVYIIAHKSRDAAKANWAAFGADPEWQKVNTESQVNGKIVAKVDSVFLDPTDFSMIK